MVEAVFDCAVNVDYPYHALALDHDGDDDFAFAGRVAGDVAWELLDVGDELSCLGGGCCAADSAAEVDGLAGDFALKRTQDEAWFCGRGGVVVDVEAGPVYRGGGGGEGAVEVPEEGGGVGEVAALLSARFFTTKSVVIFHGDISWWYFVVGFHGGDDVWGFECE